MDQVFKNSITGRYNLQINDNVFESDVADSFEIDSKEIEGVLIETFPLNVSIDLVTQHHNPELQMIRITGDLIDIIIYESEGWITAEYVSHYFYNELKEEIIRAFNSGKTKLEFYNIGHDGDLFEYTIRFSATTVGEAVQLAMEIDKTINSRMIQVGEQGAKYMRLLANGAFQIDVTEHFSDNKNNTDSKV